ncbi:MAG: peptidoglycan-binding domain-containing protein, partial [Saprospiraceae bacterium]|nr:peptidoglycan-binding domain-containing protein [Saprospiraceae bacterium]
KKDAVIREEEIQAEFVTITKQVVKSPPSVREEEIPAETRAVSVMVVKTPASIQSEEIVVETAPVTRRNLLYATSFSEWREVLCGEKVTGYTIIQIQEALNKAGYNVGTPDGKMGPRSKAQLTKFQKDKKLPIGQLDMETLKALGLN